jgi:hypothetical protein
MAGERGTPGTGNLPNCLQPGFLPAGQTRRECLFGASENRDYAFLPTQREVSRMKRLSEPCPELVTQDEVKDLLLLIDRRWPVQEGCLSERNGSEFFDRSGLSYRSYSSPLTVVCETVSDTYYFQAGMLYRMDRVEFYKLVIGIEPIGGDYALSKYNKWRLKPTEAAFILGILSAIDPLSAWAIIGMDLLDFVMKSRKDLDKWSLELASLLLTQQMLKKYARGLYQKIFQVLSDGAWCNLPDSVSTDDVAIARFAGYLFASYRSHELMDKMIKAHWAISFQILKRFSSVAGHQLKARKKVGWQIKQVEILRRSFHKIGVKVGADEVRSYLDEIKSAADEIQNIVRILSGAADGIGCRHP